MEFASLVVNEKDSNNDRWLLLVFTKVEPNSIFAVQGYLTVASTFLSPKDISHLHLNHLITSI